MLCYSGLCTQLIQPLTRAFHFSVSSTEGFTPSRYVESKEIMAPYHRVKLSMFPFVLDFNMEIREGKLVNPVEIIQFPEIGEVYDIGESIIEIKFSNFKETIFLTNPLPGKIHDINNEFVKNPNEKSWLYIVDKAVMQND